MKTTIYGYQNSSGRIVSYSPYLDYDYNGCCALELVVEIPEELNVYISNLDDVCIDYKGCKQSLAEMLYCNKGKPGICYCDMEEKRDVHRMLKIVEEKGWVSCAMTI